MFLRFSLRTRRRICVATLAAWVFALASGAVNACALTAHEAGEANSTMTTGSFAEVDDDHDDDHGEVSAADHQVAHASHGDHGDSHPGCHKFCKDSSGTLPKQAAVHGPDLSHLLLATGVVSLAPPISVPRAQRVAERPWANGPPIVIRFLRLTL
jgi:hypothetical protein